MQDLIGLLAALRRPRLLIRAARIGAGNYRREAHLPPVLACASLPPSGAAMIRLLEIEADHDEARKRGDTAYSVLRHVTVLIALMGEARLVCTSPDLSSLT